MPTKKSKSLLSREDVAEIGKALDKAQCDRRAKILSYKAVIGMLLPHLEAYLLRGGTLQDAVTLMSGYGLSITPRTLSSYMTAARQKKTGSYTTDSHTTRHRQTAASAPVAAPETTSTAQTHHKPRTTKPCTTEESPLLNLPNRGLD